jgi:hypothetical protein
MSMTEQITITSEQQLGNLLQIFGSVEVLVPQLTTQQHLAIEALAHKPLWQKVSPEEFEAYKKQTIEFQSKIMGATLDIVMTQMKHMFDDMSERDEQILRDNFYLKTPEYATLGKGMQQCFYLINAMHGAIARPCPTEYQPANQ